MAETGTVLYSSGLTNAHQNIGSGGNIYMLEYITGAFPAGNYKITSAVIRVRVRNANWMTWVFLDGYGVELGRMPIMGAGGDRESPIATDYPYGNTPLKVVIYGEGSPGAQLESGTYVQIEVKWEISTTACTPPTAVNLDKPVAETNALLSWSGAGGGVNNPISYYQVYYKDTGDTVHWSDYAFFGQTGNTFLYVTPPDTPGHIRQFFVRAVGAAGDAYASGLAHSGVLSRNVRPTPPSGLAVSPALYESGAVTVTWTAGADYEGQQITYQVMYRVSADGTTFGELMFAGYAAGTSFTHAPSLSRGHRIRYYVQSIDTLYATSDLVYAGEVQRNRRPSAPASLTASPAVFECDMVTLTWGASVDPDDNLQAYQVLVRYMPPGGSWGDFTGLAVVDRGVTTYRHAPSVSRGGSVQYAVYGWDALGAASDFVYAPPVTRNTLPDAPTNGSVIPAVFEAGSLQVQWSPSSKPGVTYVIRYAVDGGEPVTAGETADTAYALAVSVPRGAVVQVQVCARDTLSAFSPWVTAGTARRNALPRPPVLEFGSGVTRCGMPCFGCRVEAEPDQQGQQLQYRVVDGQGHQVIPYTIAASVTGAGQQLVTFRTPALGAGQYTLYTRTVDALGAVSSASPSVQFSVAQKDWARTIVPGAVIADQTISHRADIHELLAEVNARRAWYGKPEITLEGVGYFARWAENMVALRAGLTELFPVCGITHVWSTMPGTYPRAAVISEIRQMINQV